MDVLLCGGLLFTLSFERGRVSRLLERPGFLRLEHLASGDVRLSDSLSAAPLLGAHRPQARDGNQMSDALGAISVVIIVAMTMVLAVAWDRWQMKDNGQRRAV